MISNESENAACAPKRRKPRARKVFVLLAVVHYETSSISGVYGTMRRAEKARDALIAAKGYQPDEYQIEAHTVDA